MKITSIETIRVPELSGNTLWVEVNPDDRNMR